MLKKSYNVNCSGIINKVSDWFEENGRHFYWRNDNLSLYELITCEFFLWRTHSETVEKFVYDFFEKYPTYNEILNVKKEILVEDIKCLGLYNRRAEILKNFFEVFDENDIPSNEDEFRKIFPVGQYISRYILVRHYGSRKFPVDTNVERFFRRIFNYKIRNLRKINSEDEKFLIEILEIADNISNKINFIWAVLDFSSLICNKKNPSCDECPIQNDCLHLS